MATGMMRPWPEPRVVSFLGSIADEGVGLASVSDCEVLDGIGRLAPGWRRRSLVGGCHDLLGELFEDRGVDWTLAGAQACAKVKENKRQHGEALVGHVPYAVFAAAAFTRGLAVVTRSIGEFRNSGVETVNPWTAGPR